MRLLRGESRHVTQVDVYESPAVDRAFTDKERVFKEAGKDATKIWVFHGTAEGILERICSGGFRVAHGSEVVNGAVYGNGVYTSKGPGTPMRYAGGANAVILSLALPGVTGAQGKADSWTPKEDWMIFKTGEQLCPRYVVRVE